jgi:hypothetical protein
LNHARFLSSWLVHDKDNIVGGDEDEQSKTYETMGLVTQEFVVSGAKD